MKRRLFIATPLSEEANEEIQNTLERISVQISRKFRFTPIEYRHVTLLFLGDQDESAIPSIVQALQKAASRTCASVFVKLERIHYGPDDRRARMIWASGDKTSSKTLSMFRRYLVEALHENSIAWNEDDRAFHTHITLARLPSGPARFLGILDSPKSISGGSLHGEWRCSNMDLMESVLTPQGAKYQRVERVALP